MVSLFAVWCALVVEVVAFFLARFAVSGVLGLRGASARLGFVPDAWRAVSLFPASSFAASGPFGCYLVAAACFTLSLSIGGEPRATPGSMRVTRAPHGPAAAGGRGRHDRIVSRQAPKCADWAALRSKIQARKGEPVPLVVERAGRQVELRPVVGADGRIGVGPLLSERRSVSRRRADARGSPAPLRRARRYGTRAPAGSGPVETSEPGRHRPRGGAHVDRSARPSQARSRPAASLISYFIFVPMLAALILFPRPTRPLA